MSSHPLLDNLPLYIHSHRILSIVSLCGILLSHFLSTTTMHILFLEENTSDTITEHINPLASYLVQNGHLVTTITKEHHPAARRRDALNVHIGSSLLPKPLIAALFIWKKKPAVIHLTNWHYAPFVRLFAFLSPNSTYVWTIDHLNSQFNRFISWQAYGAFDVITTPKRSIQYSLLTSRNIRATYIPNGYTPPGIRDIPASKYNLRKGQFCVVIPSNTNELEVIAKAYREVNTRKKLVVLIDSKIQTKHLKRRFPFIQFLLYPHGRAALSLIRQAGVVITSIADHRLLQAMNANRPVVTIGSNPTVAEVAGTTTQTISVDDYENLKNVLERTVKNPKKYASPVEKAAKRAQNHFTWSRISEDYFAAYRSTHAKKVPMDSLISPHRATIGA